ncbi:hypothetical protein SCLARK_001849 [Spiroplasma clarkii]|uniref:Uncharacterized protein n=1 Tax=Spiroplasma clarkii TaxID=2139 RepID=A0A1Y0L3K0_9MOLU|nr:hypothetical protein [Spiroplasma clarkii]ARU92288.1 hypothetical protein SCLARK_001849 [Spiroplasma clarkii]ATX71596.1 hypothetical protein SCLAR_v1c12980 [Spiroplasma clarkii]
MFEKRLKVGKTMMITGLALQIVAVAIPLIFAIVLLATIANWKFGEFDILNDTLVLELLLTVALIVLVYTLAFSLVATIVVLINAARLAKSNYREQTRALVNICFSIFGLTVFSSFIGFVGGVWPTVFMIIPAGIGFGGAIIGLINIKGAPVNVEPDKETTRQEVFKMAFVLSLVTTIFSAIFIIPLIWMIPMTIYCNKYSKDKEDHLAFAILMLIFVNTHSGIMLLIPTDENQSSVDATGSTEPPLIVDIE